MRYRSSVNLVLALKEWKWQFVIVEGGGVLKIVLNKFDRGAHTPYISLTFSTLETSPAKYVPKNPKP